MKNSFLINENLRIKEELINKTLVVFTVFFGILGGIVMTIRGIKYGFNIASFVSYTALTLLVLITVYRKRLKTTFKIVFVAFLAILALVAGLMTVGVLAHAKYFIVLIPILCYLILDFKSSLKVLLFFIVMYYGFAILYVQDILEIKISPNDYANDIISWIDDGIIAFGVAFSSLIILRYYNDLISRRELKFEMLFESSNDAIFLFERNKLLDCNDRAIKLFNIDKKTILKDYNILIPENQSNGDNSESRLEEVRDKLKIDKPFVFDFELINSNNEIVNVSVSLNMLKIQKKLVVQAVLRDITKKKEMERDLESYQRSLEEKVKLKTKEFEKANLELKQTLEDLKSAQNKLIQSEKMASLGILTAGVAHEINNPLNFIKGSYYGIKDTIRQHQNGNKEEMELLLHGLSEGIERVTRIVGSLHQFSRADSDYSNECDIVEVVSNSLVLLAGQIKDTIKIKNDSGKEELKVIGNLGELQQVFVNILHNSIQAIKDNGEIIINSFVDDSTVIVEVRDNGIGISKKDINKILDPFYTTKPVGEGTGLGMYLSYNIIKEHKGDIQVESELGKGTLVRVILPHKN